MELLWCFLFLTPTCHQVLTQMQWSCSPRPRLGTSSPCTKTDQIFLFGTIIGAQVLSAIIIMHPKIHYHIHSLQIQTNTVKVEYTNRIKSFLYSSIWEGFIYYRRFFKPPNFEENVWYFVCVILLLLFMISWKYFPVVAMISKEQKSKIKYCVIVLLS